MTLSILIDYSKVFDTTDHHILHEKLQNMNFAKNNINIICTSGNYNTVWQIVTCHQSLSTILVSWSVKIDADFLK